MVFLDFFDDFLGESETEPDGESLRVPSLLQHGESQTINSKRADAYLTCQHLDYTVKHFPNRSISAELAYEPYCYRPERHSTCFFLGLYIW